MCLQAAAAAIGDDDDDDDDGVGDSNKRCRSSQKTADSLPHGTCVFINPLVLSTTGQLFF